MNELDFDNETIEKLLLKRALVDKNWVGILSKVFDKRWFKLENLGLILKLVCNYYNKYQSIPNNKVIVALIKKYIEKKNDSSIKISSIEELLNEIGSMNLNLSEDVLQTNLKEFIRRNAFYTSLFDNAELLEKDQSNYSKVVDRCLENFDKVQKITFNDTDLGMNYFNEQDMNEHWDSILNPEAKIPTGWSSLDHYTNGGFYKDGRCLVLFEAQAGLGKSVFLSNIAVNFMKKGHKVVVISLEMSEDVYANRFDAHISYSDINRLKENHEDAVNRIKDFYVKHPSSALFIKEYPPRSIKTSDIQTYLENLKNAGYDFDVIIVDYLNLVLPERNSDNMYKDGLSVSEKLRALSYTFNVPVISAVQANSEGMNTENIGMSNISESRGIAHTADAIFALYQTNEDREQGIVNLKLEKNRFGGKLGKICSFKLNPESLILSDVTFDSSFSDAVDDNSSTAIINGITSNFESLSSDLSDI